MPTLTLAIPHDLKKEMDALPEMNWSEVARKAIKESAAEYKLFKRIVAKSKLTQKDAKTIGDKISTSMYKQYRKAHEKMKHT